MLVYPTRVRRKYNKGCARCNIPDIIKQKEEDRGNREGGDRGGAIATAPWKTKMTTTLATA